MRLYGRWVLLLGCLLSVVAKAQVQREEYMDWGEFVAACIDEANAEDNTSQLEAQLEQLEEWHEHPLNINRVVRDELLRLPFLTPEQADSILSYRQRYRCFRQGGQKVGWFYSKKLLLDKK